MFAISELAELAVPLLEDAAIELVGETAGEAVGAEAAAFVPEALGGGFDALFDESVVGMGTEEATPAGEISQAVPRRLLASANDGLGAINSYIGDIETKANEIVAGAAERGGVSDVLQFAKGVKKPLGVLSAGASVGSNIYHKVTGNPVQETDVPLQNEKSTIEKSVKNKKKVTVPLEKRENHPKNTETVRSVVGGAVGAIRNTFAGKYNVDGGVLDTTKKYVKHIDDHIRHEVAHKQMPKIARPRKRHHGELKRVDIRRCKMSTRGRKHHIPTHHCLDDEVREEKVGDRYRYNGTPMPRVSVGMGNQMEGIDHFSDIGGVLGVGSVSEYFKGPIFYEGMGQRHLL